MRLPPALLIALIALTACGTTQAEQRAVGFVGAAAATVTDSPSPSPSAAPIVPTLMPTPVPTVAATIVPTLVPTIAPTPVATPVPTVARTAAPFVPSTPAPSSLALQPPQLVSIGVSAITVVAGGSVVFSAHITDPGGSGVTMVVVMFNGSDGQTQAAYAYLHLVSGTNLDGTWQTPIPVPAASAPGTWTLRGFYMQNAAGNADGRLPTALASQASFTVTR